MKTIEQYEAEIQQKSALIEQGLAVFDENIGHLRNVIGKDPQYVYDILSNKYAEVMEIYTTSTRRSVEILEGHVVKLDKILDVLSSVHSQINKASQEHPDELMDQVIDEITSTMDDIAEPVDDYVEDKTNISVGRDITTMAIVGVGSYILLRYLGLGRLVSMAGAGAATYMLVGPEAQAEEALTAMVVSEGAPPA